MSKTPKLARILSEKPNDKKAKATKEVPPCVLIATFEVVRAKAISTKWASDVGQPFCAQLIQALVWLGQYFPTKSVTHPTINWLIKGGKQARSKTHADVLRVRNTIGSVRERLETEHSLVVFNQGGLVTVLRDQTTIAALATPRITRQQQNLSKRAARFLALAGDPDKWTRTPANAAALESAAQALGAFRNILDASRKLPVYAALPEPGSS